MRITILLFWGAIICTLNAKIFDEAKLLNQDVRTKLEQMSAELESKTGVRAHLLTHINSENLSLQELAKDYIDKNQPYAMLILIPKKAGEKSGKVDLLLSDSKLCDKGKILSPLPNTGSILPILVANKAEDIYNAALLNGFADVCEQIAKNKDIELQSAIGNQNRNTVNIIRYFVYATLFLVFAVLLFRKVKFYTKNK